MAKNAWIDFKAVKAGASFVQVLGRYRVTLRRVNASSLKGNCPLPSHETKSEGTFYVNEEKNVWYCHSESCKANGKRAGGNVIDFVAAMENCGAYDAAAKLADWFPECNRVGAENSGKAPKPAEKPETPKPERVAEKNIPLAFELKGIRPDHPFIAERGITPETAEAWGVGFFPGKGSMANRIVFPLRDLGGQLIGYAGRSIDGAEPKWKMPGGLVKDFLYGLDRCDPAKPLIVCESPWGVLFFFQQGLQAAAIIGCSLTPAQEKALESFATIIVAMDNDLAGREAAAKIAERLKGRHAIRKAYVKE